MPTIETKYAYGQTVSCYGLVGKITAIFVRNAVSYEFSSIDNDGKPQSICREECELEASEPQAVGFKTNGLK